MVKASLYGREIALDRYKRFIGINLGFSYIPEHNDNIKQIARGINQNTLSLYNGNNLKNKMRLHKEVTLLKRFKNTPFGETVLCFSTPYLRREIIIDNSSIKDKYNTFTLENGEYIILYIGNMNKEAWHNQFGNRRKFTEEEILYMKDYQHTGNTVTEADIQYEKMMYGNTNFVGAWSTDANNIIIIEKKYISPSGHTIDDIIDSLTKAKIGLAFNERRIFKDRGLQLIDLDMAYLVGRR